MGIILIATKICITLMIMLISLYIYLLIEIKTFNKCETDALGISYCLLFGLVMLEILLFHMLIGVFTRNYNEINWDYDFFEINNNESNQYNIMFTFILVQVIFSYIGLLSLKCIWNYYKYIDTNCLLLNEFIGFGFITFFIVSIVNYYNLCYFLVLGIITIIIPKKMFYYFDKLLENRSKLNIKVFQGDNPECCICYEENCWINQCGHLICKKCVLQMNRLKCPLCKGNINLLQSYKIYIKNHNK
jgi:hypothetical protein